MRSMTLFCIVIVNYNSGSRLQKCVRALLAQTYRQWQCIVVDNASCDRSMKIAELRDPRFISLCLDTNTGFAAANNRAFDLVKADWFITLNPDAYPRYDWLEQLVDATRRYPFAKMFGCTQLDAFNHNILDGAGDCYHAVGVAWRGGYGQPAVSPYPEGEIFGPCAAAAMYEAQALRLAGGFDEDFFCYCEDVDLAFRLRLLGEYAVQIGSAVVYHEGSAISGSNSYFTLYHSSKNRLWTFIKCMPTLLIFFLLPFHIIYSLLLVFRVPRVGQIKPQLKGLIDGFLGLPRMLRKRRQIQRRRIAASSEIASSMQWSVSSLRLRRPHIK